MSKIERKQSYFVGPATNTFFLLLLFPFGIIDKTQLFSSPNYEDVLSSSTQTLILRLLNCISVHFLIVVVSSISVQVS